MLVKEELAKLRDGDNSALERLFKEYSRPIYREALMKNGGNQKAAAKAVLEAFYNINAIAKKGTPQDSEIAVSVLARAQKEEKIEEICLNAVLKSLMETINASEKNDTAIADSGAWVNGKKMETVAQHVAQVNAEQSATVDGHEVVNDATGNEENLLIQDYPDDVLEGVEMEAKRKKTSKQNIIMLVVIIILMLFLAWSLIGIILAVNPSTSHIDIGFGAFINMIRKLIGW